ncbi:MAG: AAA family ATPase [Paracoccaceae bacterium]|nr:AAA family ATPase [Paracoccaceae bacterium]
MDDVKSDRFAVLSPGLVVPRLEEIEQRFIATWVRMKQNVKPGYRRAQLSYQDERKAKAFAADAHARRLREAGLGSLPKEAHAGVTALARDGAALSGPLTRDEVYRMVADLHAESGWMHEVSTWVMQQMLAHIERGGRGLALPPVILTGPPGIGKSHYARRLADLAAVPSRIIDVGGGSAGFRVVGTERGWATAQPGIPVETILASRIANCVMIVDEVDKAGTIHSAAGRPSSLTTSLLPLLEPGSSRRFECPYHRLSFDMSQVDWIMTSNNADLIPPPLRDRVRVFHLAGLKPDEAVAVFERMTQCSDDRSGQHDCRAFIKRLAARPEGISLRQIRQLADAVTAPPRPLTH